MVTLHGYILRDLLKTFGLALTGLTALFTLGAPYNVIRLDGVTTADVVLALPILIPLMMTLAMPLSALFAAALTYGRLAADNELTACKAAGINVHRLFLAVMLLSLLVTLFMTVSVNYVMPRIYQELEHYGRNHISEVAFSQLRQRGYVRYGSEEKAQHLLTAQSVRKVDDDELVRRGFEPPAPKLSYFWIDEPRYLWVDAEGNLARFISADGALVMFDTRQSKVLVTIYVRDGRGNDYEVGKRAVGLHEQPMGPIELPIPFSIKTSMVDLNTLLAWRAEPWTPPDVASAAQGFLERLRVRHFAYESIEQLNRGEKLTLSGADGRSAVISAQSCVAGDKDAVLRDVQVVLTDAAHPRSVTYQANEARMSARLLGNKDSLVEIKMKAVEEQVASESGRRGRAEPPRKREDVFIDGLRIPEPMLAATATLIPQNVVDPAWSPPAGLALGDSRASVLETASYTFHRVISNIHLRLGTAVSALVTVLLGAILGVMFRGSRALVAIGLAASVLIVVFLLIFMGKTLTENARTFAIGPYVIWGTIVLTGLADLMLMRVGAAMTVLDRLLARTYLGGFVILSLLFIGFYTLIDLMANVDEFTNDANATAFDSLRYMWDFYRYNWPLYYSQVSGPVMTIAAAFTLGMMLRNNEMTALIAAGMPLQRLVAPLLVVSLLLVGVWVANREMLIPNLAEKIARTKNDVVGSRTIGVYFAIDDRNRILTARQFFPKEGRLQWLYIVEPKIGNQPCNLIQADSAVYDASRKTWLLERGIRIRPSDPSAGSGLGTANPLETVNDYSFALTPEQLVLRRASQWADYMSLSQLNTLLQSRNLPNRPTIDMSRHARITQPISQFVLVALALPFFLLRSPGNVIGAAGKSLLMSGAFFVAMFISQAVMPEERFAPLASWAPILLFGPLAVVRIASVKT